MILDLLLVTSSTNKSILRKSVRINKKKIKKDQVQIHLASR